MEDVRTTTGCCHGALTGSLLRSKAEFWHVTVVQQVEAASCVLLCGTQASVQEGGTHLHDLTIEVAIQALSELGDGRGLLR